MHLGTVNFSDTMIETLIISNDRPITHSDFNDEPQIANKRILSLMLD